MEVLMGRALSRDLRLRVVQAFETGMSARQAGLRFGVSASTAVRWVSRARDGELEPRPMGNRGGSRLDACGDVIIDLVELRKDITLNEMVIFLDEEHGVEIGRSQLSNWLRKQGYTFKKRPLMHWSKSAPIS